jgi:hypothetical protein
MLLLNPQMLLDAICNEVGTHNYSLFVGWSIGQRDAVLTKVVEQFGSFPMEIHFELQKLIDQGWLTPDTQIPDFYSGQDVEHLAITHDGWLKWTHFDEIYLDELGFATVEEWRADGIHNTTKRDCVEVFAFKTKPTPKRIATTPKRIARRSIDEQWFCSMDETTDLKA